MYFAYFLDNFYILLNYFEKLLSQKLKLVCDRFYIFYVKVIRFDAVNIGGNPADIILFRNTYIFNRHFRNYLKA